MHGIKGERGSDGRGMTAPCQDLCRMMKLNPHTGIQGAMSFSSGTSDCFRIGDVQSKAKAGLDLKVVRDMVPDVKVLPDLVPILMRDVKVMHNLRPHLVPKIDMKVVADMVPHTKVVNHRSPLHCAAPHCVPPVRDPRECY